MSGPHAPQPHFNQPPPGFMPPQPGNMPPQPPQHPNPNQPVNSAYLNGQLAHPVGFAAHEVSPFGDTHVTLTGPARPSQPKFNAVLGVPRGKHPHEWRADDKRKAADELYEQRGSEKFWGALPRAGRFLGRVAFKGTTTPPEKIQAGHTRKEVGPVVRFLAAPIGAVALVPAVVSKGILMPFRIGGNLVQGRAASELLKPVVPKRGEGPRQLRHTPPAQSPYASPYHQIGGNMPTSPKQARQNARAAKNQQRQQLNLQKQQQVAQAKAQKTQAKAQAKASKQRRKTARITYP